MSGDALALLRAAVLDCGDAGLCIRGGGSKDFYGQALRGAMLDTREHRGIVDYEPSELVVTARAGTPLAELETALGEKNQMLAFEPPRFSGGHATVGGCLAAGLAGPRRAAAGAVRDHVLGVQLLDGKGEILKFGGQVMKNVAGLDVSRLIAGSLGTLGLIVEVSFKVLPKPVRECSLRFALEQSAALDLLNRWAGRPLPISASCWHAGVLTLRLSGASAAVAAAKQHLGGEEVADDAAATFWSQLRDQNHDFFAGPAPLWRLSVASTAPAIDLPGEQLIEWGGGERWWRGDESSSDSGRVRAVALRAGGHATLFRGGDKAIGVFQKLAPELLALHRRVKDAFDPRGIFNPGRLYDDF